jgi:DNA-binding transcriptional LysR family regulator
MRLTQLDGLIAFITVAKHKSFTSAASELDLSAAALSQAVRVLEERVGVRLFNRTTRSVSLTEAGEEYLGRVAPAISDLLDATESLSRYRDKPVGLLRLNAGRVVVATLLRDLVPAFLAEHPTVRIEVHVDDGFCDIVAEGFDAGFRLGESVEKDMVAVPFGPPMQIAIVGSPEYVRRRGMPRTVDELKNHDLIRYRFPSSKQLYRWELIENERPVEVETHGAFVCNDSVLMVEAALDGLGLAYTFDLAVCEHIKAGRLVRVLQDNCPIYPGFYVYYPGRRQLPLKLRKFIDFCTARLRSERR